MPTEVVRRFPTSRRARWYERLRGKRLAPEVVILSCGAAFLVAVGVGDPAIGLATGVVVVLVVLSATTVLRRLLRPRGEYERRVDDEFGLEDLAAARASVARIEAAWPELSPVAGEPPQPVLGAALWDLAGELRTRGEIRAAGVELEQLLAELPEEDPARVALTQRADELALRYSAVSSSVADRVERLARLADECELHVAVQAAQARVAEVARRADAVLGGTAVVAEPATPDPAAELAERTAAVLTAYRELLDPSAL